MTLIGFKPEGCSSALMTVNNLLIHRRQISFPLERIGFDAINLLFKVQTKQKLIPIESFFALKILNTISV